MDVETESDSSGSSLRDTLMESAEAVESQATEVAAEPVVEAAPAPTVETTDDKADDKPTRARDETGRFAPKEKTAAKVVVPTPRPATQAAAKAAPAADAGAAAAPQAPTQTESYKPPASWKPALREKWGSVPADIQAEMWRRERETTQALNDAAPARQLHQAFNQALAPHAQLIQAHGGDPFRVIDGLLRERAVMTMGPPEQRAQALAAALKSSGVPLELFAQALDGTMQPGQQQPAARHLDPDAIIQQAEQRVIQRLQSERAQATQARTAREISEFGATHEFFEDVRGDMAYVLEDAHRRGLSLTPEQAYTRACQLNPDVAAVFQQREAAKQANAKLASTQRARAAASSVRSQPVGEAPESQPADLRSQIRAAADASSRG